MARFPYYQVSMNGIPIRLTEERWLHITKHHPELKAFRRLILNTIANPDSVFFLSKTGDFAAVARFSELVTRGLASILVVHYRETMAHDGFIVTAFPISAKRMNRRFTRWQRLK